MSTTPQSGDTGSAFEHTHCALCGRDDARLRLTSQDWLHGGSETFTLVECRECGLVYLNPRPTAAALPHYYPDDYAYAPGRPYAIADIDQATLSQRLRRLVQTRYYDYPLPRPRAAWLKPLSTVYHLIYWTLALPIIRWRPAGRILDVGCGMGDYLASQSQLGWEVEGVEINPRAVQHAREKLHLEVFQGDLLQANLPAQHFDVVTMWWYLEHVPNPLAVLQEARRIIKPGGVLWIGVPNWASWEARLFRTAWYHLDAPRHFYLFTPVTLRAMLERAGWRIEQRPHISWLADPAESVERWWQIRTGRPHTLPRLVRLLLAPMGWLAARLRAGSLLVVAARPDAAFDLT